MQIEEVHRPAVLTARIGVGFLVTDLALIEERLFGIVLELTPIESVTGNDLRQTVRGDEGDAHDSSTDTRPIRNVSVPSPITTSATSL
jgi:hypothetical protein